MLTLPSQVHTALDRLTAAGWEAYVVGGAVRDALRGCAAGIGTSRPMPSPRRSSASLPASGSSRRGSGTAP